MKIGKSVLSLVLLAGLGLNLNAQEQVEGFVHEQSATSDYVWPTDPQVLEKLDKWQDLKFGVLFHWGLYSVPGIVESWSICSEDEDWISRKKNLPYDEYKKWYWGLKDSLNPVNFNPEQWAEVMADAGMKYMILRQSIMTVFVCLIRNIRISPSQTALSGKTRAGMSLFMYLMLSGRRNL